MSLSLNESLSKLEKLSPARLHQTSHRLRAALGGAEWKMALCLLATARTRSYRTLGFASVTEYADKALSLSGNKVGCLLGTARALEHLPLLSEAFQQGRIGWGKVRAIRGLATPETENAWLDFALAHRTDEVVRKVALSPRAWKRHQALQASLEGQPICTDAAVAKVLKGEPETASSAPSTGATSVIATGATTAACAHALGISSAAATANCGVTHGSSGMTNLTSGLASTYDSLGLEGLSAPCLNERSPLSASSPPNKPLLPLAPKTIRLVVEMTPDQYALYEQAESRVRAQARKHLSRAAVVTRMAESVLNNGTARAPSTRFSFTPKKTAVKLGTKLNEVLFP